MKRERLTTFLTIILVFMTNLVSGQAGNREKRNLSYHVVGIIGNIPQVGGTGFFVKKGQSYYLVSAWHSFSFKNHTTGVAENKSSDLIKEVIVYRDLEDIKTNNYSRVQLIDPITQQLLFSKRSYLGEAYGRSIPN